MALARTELLVRLRGIRLLALDVDGVLTDGRILIAADGQESKQFHVRDGLGLRAVMDQGIEVAILSGRRAPVVEHRMRELGITRLQQGVADKGAALRELAATLGLQTGAVAFVGDDLIDLPAMACAGLGIAVQDAEPAVLEAADWVTERRGGQGAVREVCDLLLAADAR